MTKSIHTKHMDTSNAARTSQTVLPSVLHLHRISYLSSFFFPGDIIGTSFFPYAQNYLQTSNMIAQPSGSGSEAIFNFGVNIYTLSMLRGYNALSYERIIKVTTSINIGERKHACIAVGRERHRGRVEGVEKWVSEESRSGEGEQMRGRKRG